MDLSQAEHEYYLTGNPPYSSKKRKESLLATRLNIDDLSLMLRVTQDVHYAILEPNGRLSILKKEDKQTVTKGDMKIPTAPFSYFPSEIITDGKIVKKNLKELNLNEHWIREQLKKQGIKSVKDVFYA